MTPHEQAVIDAVQQWVLYERWQGSRLLHRRNCGICRQGFERGFDHQRCEQGAALERDAPPLTTKVDIERAYVLLEAERRKTADAYPMPRL